MPPFFNSVHSYQYLLSFSEPSGGLGAGDIGTICTWFLPTEDHRAVGTKLTCTGDMFSRQLCTGKPGIWRRKPVGPGGGSNDRSQSCQCVFTLVLDFLTINQWEKKYYYYWNVLFLLYIQLLSPPLGRLHNSACGFISSILSHAQWLALQLP